MIFPILHFTVISSTLSICATITLSDILTLLIFNLVLAVLKSNCLCTKLYIRDHNLIFVLFAQYYFSMINISCPYLPLQSQPFGEDSLLSSLFKINVAYIWAISFWQDLHTTPPQVSDWNHTFIMSHHRVNCKWVSKRKRTEWRREGVLLLMSRSDEGKGFSLFEAAWDWAKGQTRLCPYPLV